MLVVLKNTVFFVWGHPPLHAVFASRDERLGVEDRRSVTNFTHARACSSCFCVDSRYSLAVIVTVSAPRFFVGVMLLVYFEKCSTVGAVGNTAVGGVGTPNENVPRVSLAPCPQIRRHVVACVLAVSAW